MSVIDRLIAMGFDVVTRGQWGTQREYLYQNRRKTHPFTLPARYAFSHISVTVDDGNLTGDFYNDMRELERIGYSRFGSGISYNWGVDTQTGMIGEGQPLDAKGTHTVNDKEITGFPYNLNLYGHAIVAIGMPGVQPRDAFFESMAAILRAEWDENVMLDGCGFYPHSKFAYKECPTQPIRERLESVRATAIDMGEAGREMNTQEAARLNWIYGAFVDGDGSPSVTTILGRIAETLERIETKLDALSN